MLQLSTAFCGSHPNKQSFWMVHKLWTFRAATRNFSSSVMAVNHDRNQTYCVPRSNLLFPSNYNFHDCRRRSIHIELHPHIESKEDKKRKSQKKSHGRPSYKFVDRMRLRAEGGIGGKGSLSMNKLTRKNFSRLDGGHGGQGGHVLLIADPNESSLNISRPHASAGKGTNGSSSQMNGAAGKNFIFKVPCGVIVHRVLDFDETWDPEQGVVRKLDMDGDHAPQIYYDEDMIPSEDSREESHKGGEILDSDNVVDGSEDNTSVDMGGNDEMQTSTEVSWTDQIPLNINDNEEDTNISADDIAEDSDFLVTSTHEFLDSEERERVLIADLDKPGAHILVARGGKGGRGSCSYASKTGPKPDPFHLIERAKPERGEVAFLELELKLIADVGLVGFPNAGKSSLLRAMSKATPEVAPYPFTTLHPLLGCIEYRDNFKVLAADVPGLVAGASEGRGRGHDFLRHLERTKSLLFMVDAAGVDGRDPVEDLRILTDELLQYGDGDLMTKPALVVANKFDLLDDDARESIMLELGIVAEEAGVNFDGHVLGISAGVSGFGLGSLSRSIREMVVESETLRHAQY